MKAPTLIALVSLLLTGCETGSDLQTVPEVRALQKLQTLQTQQQYSTIAEQPVPGACASPDPGSVACAKIYAIRAQACLLMAQKSAGPDSACPESTPDTRRWIDCAVDGYRKAGGASQNADELNNLLTNKAHALYCSARLHAPDEAVQARVARAQQAESTLQNAPATAQNAMIRASSALFIAQQTTLTPDERCSAARRARQSANQGLSAPSPDNKWRNALVGSANAARQEAALIAGCTGG
jgi:hypothetical protein